MNLIEWKMLVYLIIIDYYTKFIEIHIAELHEATEEAVIQHCKNIF